LHEWRGAEIYRGTQRLDLIGSSDAPWWTNRIGALIVLVMARIVLVHGPRDRQ
jgi:hypothetical protein